MRKQFLFILSLVFITASWADDSTPDMDNFNHAINLAGISYAQSLNNLEISIEVNKALAAIPVMQRSGVLNPQITAADIKLLPVTLSVSLVGMFYTAGILQQIFTQNKGLNGIHIIGYVLAANQFGVMNKMPCYAFDFNRDTYNKINWETFTAPNLITMSKNFYFTPWCKAIMHQETGQPT